MSRVRVLMLAGAGRSTRIIYHALAERFDVVGVVVEEPIELKTFLARRVRRLGWTTVLGQLAFRALVVPTLERASRRRVHVILEEAGGVVEPIDPSRVHSVPSVNAPEVLELIGRLDPDVIVINGTRIIARRVLERLTAPILNMHAGITPQYRGVHGGYWALAQRDPGRCGVSVHLVDAGIDTGGVVAQALIRPDERDDFTTYPTLQLVEGLPLLKRAIADAAEGELELIEVDEEGSRLWSHPTVWGYMATRMVLGVR